MGEALKPKSSSADFSSPWGSQLPPASRARNLQVSEKLPDAQRHGGSENENP